MGMGSMFNGTGSTFDHIVHNEGTPEPLFIDYVLHQAVINVDEEGTVAAAATVIATRSMPYPFKANKPFLYMLRSSSTIYFMGQYTGNGN
jgi:serpin B